MRLRTHHLFQLLLLYIWVINPVVAGLRSRPVPANEAHLLTPKAALVRVSKPTYAAPASLEQEALRKPLTLSSLD